MGNIAVLFAPGFEEGEALTIVDILRRAKLDAGITGLGDGAVTGGHGITVQPDWTIGDVLLSDDLDMVVLPGGYPGVDALLASEEVGTLLKKMDRRNKWIGAMCAAPLVLEKAGLLNNRRFTAYWGYGEKIKSGHFSQEIVVRDENLITGGGPATVYAFAYALVDALGGDSAAIKQRMLYFHSFKEEPAQ